MKMSVNDDLLKHTIDYDVPANATSDVTSDVAKDAKATSSNVGDLIKDAATEKVGSDLWDAIIKGV